MRPLSICGELILTRPGSARKNAGCPRGWARPEEIKLCGKRFGRGIRSVLHIRPSTFVIWATLIHCQILTAVETGSFQPKPPPRRAMNPDDKLVRTPQSLRKLLFKPLADKRIGHHHSQ